MPQQAFAFRTEADLERVLQNSRTLERILHSVPGLGGIRPNIPVMSIVKVLTDTPEENGAFDAEVVSRNFEYGCSEDEPASGSGPFSGSGSGPNGDGVWLSGGKVWAFDLNDCPGTLKPNRRYLGIGAGWGNGRPLVVVLASAQGSGGSPFWIVTANTPPNDEAPTLDIDGNELVPPRYSHHLYSVTPITYNKDDGEWVEDDSRNGGDAVRGPSTQFVPPMMIPGTMVVGHDNGEVVEITGQSIYSNSFTFVTRSQLLCVDGNPMIAHYQRTVRLIGPVCFAQAASEEPE